MTSNPARRFPTSVVGSMPRPAFVKDLIFGDEEITPEAYQRGMDAAIRFVVALQERAGIDVVTDGEWRRGSYIGVIAEFAHGFELSRGADGRPMTVVIDKLSPKTPGFIAREIEFVQSITTKKIKATLPSPSPALLGERMWDPDKSRNACPNPGDAKLRNEAAAAAELLRAEFHRSRPE